jgi:hypothetical protein
MTGMTVIPSSAKRTDRAENWSRIPITKAMPPVACMMDTCGKLMYADPERMRLRAEKGEKGESALFTSQRRLSQGHTLTHTMHSSKLETATGTAVRTEARKRMKTGTTEQRKTMLRAWWRERDNKKREKKACVGSADGFLMLGFIA